MFRGLLVFGLAVCLAGAPIAVHACEAFCAGRTAAFGAASTGAASAHACHHPPVGSRGPAVTALPHVCGHSDDIPSASSSSVEFWLGAPAIVLVVAQVAPPAHWIPSGTRSPSHSRVPAQPPPLTSLRV